MKYTCNNGNWTSSGSCIKKSGSITYNYTGGVQSFKPSDHNLVNGDVIILEVWGAQGYDYFRGTSKKGGKGGYSKGKYTIKDTSKTLYIVIGREGSITKGGYNGGGFRKKTSFLSDEILEAASGGGATHISTESGTLDNESVWNNVIIVAGGGGGSYTAGSGGGLESESVTCPGHSSWKAYGASQTRAGENNRDYQLDLGGKGFGGFYINAAGGGGYYGGGASYFIKSTSNSSTICSLATGGSGYIGGLDNGTGVSEGGKREGNGMAKISW